MLKRTLWMRIQNTWPCDTTYNENDIKLDRVTIISTAEIANYCNPSSSSNGGFGIGIPEVAFGADMDDVASCRWSGKYNQQSGNRCGFIFVFLCSAHAFPRETWLWESSDSGSFEATAPDSITTWSITAFTSHPAQGISIMKTASEIIVFREFFISPKVPYSITRGETVEIVLTVFNYLKDEDMSVSISAEDVTRMRLYKLAIRKHLLFRRIAPTHNLRCFSHRAWKYQTPIFRERNYDDEHGFRIERISRRGGKEYCREPGRSV